VPRLAMRLASPLLRLRRAGVRGVRKGQERSGLRRVILPRDNERDLRELPEAVQQQMEFVLVDRIEDALAAAIPDLAARLHALAVV
jgi:ATP-dependent Lon protease